MSVTTMARAYTRKNKGYKRAQRAIIADFVLNNHQRPFGHFLTLPHLGEQERVIAMNKLGKHIKFTGCEISEKILKRCKHANRNNNFFVQILHGDIFQALIEDGDLDSPLHLTHDFTGMIIDPCSCFSKQAGRALSKIGRFMDRSIKFAPVVISLCSRLRNRASLRGCRPISIDKVLETERFSLIRGNKKKHIRAGVLKQIGAVVKSLQANRGWKFKDFVAETWRGGHGSSGTPMFTVYGILERK